jgi:hypothetical protein
MPIIELREKINRQRTGDVMMNRKSIRTLLGIPLLMVSLACLCVACVKGCDSILPKEASKYKVVRVGNTVDILFSYEKTEFDGYLSNLPMNDFYSFFVRDTSSGEKVQATCTHKMRPGGFRGRCIVQDDALIDAPAIELVAEKKSFNAKQAMKESEKAAKFVIGCLYNGTCPDYQVPAEMDAAYESIMDVHGSIEHAHESTMDVYESTTDVLWVGGSCGDSGLGDAEICSQLEKIGCDVISTKDGCRALVAFELRRTYHNLKAVEVSPTLLLEATDEDVGEVPDDDPTEDVDDSADPINPPPSGGTPDVDSAVDQSNVDADDDGPTITWWTTGTEDAGAGDTPVDGTHLDSGEGCSFVGTASANPLVFFLIAAALLPLVKKRRR